MKENPLFPFASKLRPELKKLEGGVALQAFSEVLAVLYLTPLALTALVWLIVASSRIEVPTTNLWLPVFLATGILITNNQVFNIYVGIGNKGKLALTSSFGSILYWAGIMLWGPVMIWLGLIADLVSTVQASFRLKSLRVNPFWGPFASYLQSLVPVLGLLSGFFLFQEMGGVVPFSGSNSIEWWAALVAILIASTLPGILLLPVFFFINVLTGNQNDFFGHVRFFASAVGLTLIPSPFGLPIAVLYVTAGVFPFVVISLGIILVNLLAHHLSRTNQRNEQKSKEMAQLEQLGEEILQSPPDGSRLADIVRGRLASMFSGQLDIVAVRIFEDALLPGYSDRYPVLNIIYPDPSLAPEYSVWNTLRNSDQDHVILKDQIPFGFNSVYGDAVLVKVLSAAPVTKGEKPACMGGVYLLMNKTDAKTVDSLDAVQALASQIASALYRVQVHQETLASEKMTQELEFAGIIQSSFLPESVPSLDGWSLAASLIPARQTSGDFYDFIPLGENKIGLLVADVADKGTGAALYMALSRTLLRTFAMQYPDSPAEVFRKANDRIFEDSRAEQFVTAFYGVLDLDSGQFEYCNAGHNPTYLLRSSNGQQPNVLKRTGVALGAMEGLSWKSESLSLEQGDVLLFYTDGVVEAQNESDEFYGNEQLIDVARAHASSPAESIHAQIMESLDAFVGKAAQFDDITLLTLKRE